MTYTAVVTYAPGSIIYGPRVICAGSFLVAPAGAVLAYCPMCGALVGISRATTSPTYAEHEPAAPGDAP